MSYFNILAQAAEAAPVTQGDVNIVPIDFIWEQITTLSWLQAVIAVSFGVVYLMYGWRIFKILVVISFALIGLFLGMMAGKYFGNEVGHEIWGGVIGLAILAVVSMPLMKWCVCILGAVAGGILTGALWYAFELPQQYIWAGAIAGVIAGGMMSFIVLKASVMLFTSFGGSVITVIGILALLHLYESTGVSEQTTVIHDMVFDRNWFLPIAIIVPTFIGMIVQNKFIKHSQKWEM